MYYLVVKRFFSDNIFSVILGLSASANSLGKAPCCVHGQSWDSVEEAYQSAVARYSYCPVVHCAFCGQAPQRLRLPRRRFRTLQTGGIDLLTRLVDERRVRERFRREVYSHWSRLWPHQQQLGSVGILDRTAVRTAGRCAQWLARDRFFQRLRDIVLRAWDVGLVSGRSAINGSVVDQHTGGIDDKHVRSRLRRIKSPYISFRIQQRSRGRSVHLFQVFIFLLGCDISLLARCRGDHGEPGNAFARPFFLEALHVATLVMFLRIRTAAVVPFKYHEFPTILGELVYAAIAIGSLKLRRGFAHLHAISRRY